MTPEHEPCYIEAFETGRVQPDEFGHRDHVRLAWCYLRRDGLAGALQAFPRALKRFATGAGAPQLYHETITWAYLFLIAERLEQGGDPDDWSAFSARNPELFHWPDGVLGQYYSPALLASEPARRRFVMPDRTPGGPSTS